jgi:RHS repeat-associated protein
MKTPLQQASFTKYDVMGRVVITGVFNIAGASTAGTNYRTTILTAVNAQTQKWETRLYVGTAGTTDYSASAYPTTDFTPLIINYYDKYTAIPSKPAAFVAPTGASAMTQGLLTATRTAVLSTPANMLCGMMYYDNEGRTIKTFKQHYFGGTLNAGNYDETTVTYNFSDQITTTTRKHYQASVLKVTIAGTNIYDHQGRKVKSWQQLTNGTGAADARTLISKLEYNEVGQLKIKNLHSTDSIAFKQAVAYTYNERGWLQGSSAPLFAMQLKYTDGTVPQYNGNIANQVWGVPGTLDKTYTYRYDNINRLLSGASTTNDRERSIVYDQRGNIINLTRFSNNVIIDSLNYSYTSGGIATNQLQSVNDLTTSILGQKPGNFTYTYDGNGNMVTDNSKGIIIGYNLLNLPQSIAAKSTTYTYDAGGNKLRRVVGAVATDYMDGLQYEGGALSFIQTEEGRALPKDATAYNYEYTLNDHLGNSRVGFDIFNNAVRLVQTNNYYPFGLEAFSNTASSPKNYYLYNKKELQDNLGLYDYGARLYDPVIARFTTTDPLAEKMRRHSLYSYAFNNPVRFVDPDGMAPGDPDDPWYTRVGKWFSGLFTKPVSDTYTNTRDYVSNEVDNMKNRGARYDKAIRNGGDPNQITVEYKARQTSAALKLGQTAIDWVGLNTAGIEASIGGTITMSAARRSAVEHLYGTMNNVEARSWYLTQEKAIPRLIDESASLEGQARQAFSLRNEFRTEARNLMSDRKAAADLMKTDPNQTWNQVVRKYTDRGFKGDDLWKQIIGSSQRSRQTVNQSLGLK